MFLNPFIARTKLKKPWKYLFALFIPASNVAGRWQYYCKQGETLCPISYHRWCRDLGPVSRSPCALLKLDFLTSAYKKCMRWSESPASVRRKGFVKPAPHDTAVLCWSAESLPKCSSISSHVSVWTVDLQRSLRRWWTNWRVAGRSASSFARCSPGGRGRAGVGAASPSKRTVATPRWWTRTANWRWPTAPSRTSTSNWS